MKLSVRTVAVLLLIGVLQACVQYENKRGVEVNWQSAVIGKLIKGQTSRKEVLELLGPPSQLISLDEESVLYYLFEHSEGDGMILIVYNRMKINTRYDRAVFFFDDDDILTDYSTYIHEPDSA